MRNLSVIGAPALWAALVVGLGPACSGDKDAGDSGGQANTDDSGGADDGTGDDGTGDDGTGDDGTGDDGASDSGGADGGDDSGGGPACYELADGSCVEETFTNPPTLKPDGDGVYKLTLAPTEVEIAGQRHCVRAYNDSFTGPTLDVAAREGDTPRQVRIDLFNAFEEHDFRSLYGDICECVDKAGMECVPSHGGCDEGDEVCECTNEDGELCEEMFDFNLTNLHAHGSHIRPGAAADGGCTPEDGMACRDCDADTCDGNFTDDTCYYGDDVLTEVHPNTGARYRWDLDEDGTHHEGLNWYHPHIHGTTAIQTAAGAAGAWIIRGELDEVDGVAEARERVLVFQTPSIAENGFEPLEEGVECTDETITFNDFTILSAVSSPQINLINGLRQPRMVVAPDQLERWRILDAGYLDEIWLTLARGEDSNCERWSVAEGDLLPITQIARDGLVLPQPWADDYWFMGSGYRVEAMVGGEGVFEHGDTWCMVAGRFLQSDGESSPTGEPILSPEEAPTPEEILEMLDEADVVAVINVTDDAGPATRTEPPDYDAIGALSPDMNLGGVDIEEACAAAAERSDPESIDQVAILQVGIATVDDPDPCECDNYNVNCKNFEDIDREVYPFDRDLPLGEVEHWRVQASIDGHPFHIHINPFIVCPNDNPFDPLPFPHWRDTYLINLDRKVDLITQYKEFTGAYVFHCHKLTHEDHGMMQLMRVCDPETDETCGDYHWRECAEGDLECVQALAATDCATAAANDADAFACISALGGPMQVCGPDACGGDEDCGPGTSCVDYVCEPDGPGLP